MTVDGVAEPQQDRSRESFARVREATASLLRERGSADFTLAEVSARAAVSVGSIYGRVGNKSTLLRVVQSEELDRIDAALRQDYASVDETHGSFEDAIERLVTLAVTSLTRDASLLSVFMRIGEDDRVVAMRGTASWEAARSAFSETLRSVGVAHGRDIDDATADWAHELLYSVIARQMGFSMAPSGRPPTARTVSRLIGDLARTVRLIVSS